MDKTLWRLVVANTVFSIGHHIDHVLRHRTGWPLTNVMTPFTWALAVYVVIFAGAVLTPRGMAGPGFWSILGAIGFVFIATIHYGPAADDPPSEFAAAYGNQTMAWIALVWLWLFLTSLATATVYAGWRWAMLRQKSAPARVTH